MISRIRNSIFSKFIWGLMGLYLLNISVDTADLNPEHIPEDLSFNDQESIVEILVEKVLGFEDAIKEYDDHDTGDYNIKKSVQIDFSVNEIIAEKIDKNQFFERKKNFHDYEARLLKGSNEMESPPPKV